jgi:hypothetical protein
MGNTQKIIAFFIVVQFAIYMGATYAPRFGEPVPGIDFGIAVGDSVEYAWQIHSPMVKGYWETLEEPVIDDKVIRFNWTHPNGDIIEISVPTAMSYVYKQPYR